MTLYTIALFFHVVGALGFFVALGLEWFNLQQLQRSETIDQLQKWFAATSRWRGVAGFSMLIILIAGFYMTFAAWGGADWIEVAFGAMLVQGAIAGIVTTPRMKAIQRAIADASGPITTEIEALLQQRALWVSLLVRVGMALGIIFLMTVKPALIGSIAAIAVGAVVGLVLAFVTAHPRPVPAPVMPLHE